jgi:multimeric flavodoxin WrbA
MARRTRRRVARALLASDRMKAVIISTAPEGTALADLERVVEEQLRQAGLPDIHRFDVSGGRLGYCHGEFDCWLYTPGRCKIADEQQEIARAIPSAATLVLVGPMSFGGFGWELLRATNRLICLVSPFFEKRACLTHHEARYARYPSLVSIGLSEQVDPYARTTFDALNDANAISFLAPRRVAVTLGPDQESWRSSVARALERPSLPGASISDRRSLRRELLDVAAAEPAEARPIRTASLLVGSAKPKGTSVSERLARAFLDRFAAAGVRCELHFATEFVHDDAQARAAARALAAADLFLLATPLYVDALPSLVTHALERIAGERTIGGGMFVPVINCGFPEPEHTRTAIRISRSFARVAGYRFGGALPLGGGAAAEKANLDRPHAPVVHLVRAVDAAAASLAAGHGVPARALEEIVHTPMPDAVYRMFADLGFRYRAHTLGTSQSALHARPATYPR